MRSRTLGPFQEACDKKTGNNLWEECFLQHKRYLTSAVAVFLSLGILSGCGSAANSTNSTTANTASVGTASSGTQNTTSSIIPVSSQPIPSAPQYSGPVVVTYSGGSIHKQELDTQYNLQVVFPGLQQQESMKSFVTYYVVWYKYLLGQAQKDTSIKVDPTQARQAANTMLQQLIGHPYATANDALSKLKSLGLSTEDLVRLSAQQSQLEQYLNKQLQTSTVSDAQMQSYYSQHKSDYLQVTVQHILVSSLSQAQSIEAQLKKGANFTQLADKYSQDPAVKQNHGKYVDQMASSFVPTFAKAVETLPIGEISSPVKTQFGYHIIKVDQRTQLSFTQVKSQIQQQLLTQVRNSKEQSIYNSAIAAAKVRIIVPDSQL
ncbi:hypothetical protein D2Q93_13220 [Alicyclobacillaceae bacterium I2511]|nr:hypothetical protein D2Q93_13220 [Alicyclobacillaceae bacterium I2511]